MSSVSEGGTPPFRSKRFQVVRLVLFSGVTFRMEVLARGLGGVSVEVEFLEGVARYCVGMVSWVNVGLAFFGDIDMLEVSERGLGGVSVVVEFFEAVTWYCVDMVLWVNVGLAFLCECTVWLEISKRGGSDVGDVGGHLG